MYIILAILAFGLLIIVHELGHFTLAKLNGVRVEEFSIGMGPRIFSKKGKETTYSLSLFPIGGYVKMMGEDGEVDDERSFSAKSPLRRISIIIAGVVMNYILAIIIFTAVSFNFGFAKPIVNTVAENSGAVEAGLQPGDKIVKVDGSRVFTADDVTFGIALSKDDTIDLVVKRNNIKEKISVKLKNLEGKGKQMGITFVPEGNPSFMDSVKQGLNETGTYVSQTYKGLKMLLTGEANLKTDVGGPVTIVKMTTATAKIGLWPLAKFIAIISVNLAVFNLLPFPALDGGWCVILLIELITRKKVPDKIVAGLNYVGFACLIGLMILVTIKDFMYPFKL